MYEFEDAFLAKVEEMRARGVEPWPSGLVVSHTAEALKTALDDTDDPTEVDGYDDVAVGGRVIFRNRMGRAMFLRIQDRTERIQVYLRREEVGDDAFAQIRRIDVGDFVWARGACMRTRTGELSIRAAQIRLASKILTTFPDRQHGVVDVETRSRMRYVDLFMNEDTRETFKRRSQIVRLIRDFFHDRDFMEVETPMMQVIPGGANARPFVTHHNALDLDLYLRIAPELYLKRLVVGGFERVFEINRNFRNEGVTVKHNPEFTMLEWYQAWSTHHDLMELTEALIGSLALAVCGSHTVEFGPHTLDFSPPFRRADMDQLIAEHTTLSSEDLQDPALIEIWWRANHQVGDDDSLPVTTGRWWELLFDAHVEDQLVDPTFVTGFPTEISPLSRRNDARPGTVDRFELVCATWEIANGFSELNDPVDQARRFADQVTAREAGDDEGMYFDHDYVRALTYGMPPAAGEGIGIDRLVMLLTNRASIREVILFPTLRPESSQ